MTSEEFRESPEKLEEDDQLKVGYSAMFCERAPINKNPANCFDQESAYFLHLELDTLTIPAEIRLENLINEIPEKHRSRIKAIYQKALIYQDALNRTSQALKGKWTSPPKDLRDPTARHIVHNSPMHIPDRFKRGVEKIITRKERIDKGGLTAKRLRKLQDWQADESALRRKLYEELKNYRVALRAYFEMLLEKTSDEKEYVLPKNHPQRGKIVRQNRRLQIVDAAHQAIEVAKTAHHEQGKRRLRKTGQVPFVAHELSTTTSCILDIEPYAFEEDIQIDLIITLTCCAIHDVIEDTELSIDYIIEKFLTRLVDKCDTRLAPFIKTGFEEEYRGKAATIRRNQGKEQDDREEREMILKLFQERVINLIKDSRLGAIKQVLRIVSNNTKLNTSEKKDAMKSNIAGREKTLTFAEIKEQDLRTWQSEEISAQPTSRTFAEFHEEHDEGKMAAFLIKLTAITKSERKRQHALIVKIEDRADNISSLEGMPIRSQLSTLRAAVTRLIAWCMMDHNLEKYPLYNALPRLIDEAAKAYLRLQSTNPECLEGIDIKCMEHLGEWLTNVKRFTPPADVQEVLDEYRESKWAA